MHFTILLVLLFTITHACRLTPNVLIGEINPDLAANFDGNGFITTGEFDINGGGFTFEVDVFPNTAGESCIFSAGVKGSSNFISARLVPNLGSPSKAAIEISVGSGSATTSAGVVPMGTWSKIAFTVSNEDAGGKQNLPLVVYINNDPTQMSSNIAITNRVVVGPRKVDIGKCPVGLNMNGMIDNFRFYSILKDRNQITATNNQFYPMVKSEGLLVYYDFNDMLNPEVVALTKPIVGRVGNSGLSNIPAQSFGARGIARNGTAGNKIQRFCVQQGSTIPAGSGFTNPPYYNTSDKALPGYTQSVHCGGTDQGFVINQRWIPSGGIDSISIRTSRLHYWRVTAPGLKVEHRTWGGWTTLPRYSDYIPTDKTTYVLKDDAIVIQAGAWGYIKITETRGLLNYEVGVDPSVCVQLLPNDQTICKYYKVPKWVYEFSGEPVPEMPMGWLAADPGVGGLPPILACPVPSPTYPPRPPPPPQPEPPPPPPPEIPLDPITKAPTVDICDTLDKALVAKFNASCLTTYVANTPPHRKCLADSCISGDPFDWRTVTCEAQKVMAMSDPLFKADPACDLACPNLCSGNGKCNANKQCECNPDFTGPDCGSPKEFSCWKVSSPAGEVALRPLIVRKPSTVPYTSQEFVDTQMAREYFVTDSVLTFIAQTFELDATSGKIITKYHLVFHVNDRNGGLETHGALIKVTGPGVNNQILTRVFKGSNELPQGNIESAQDQVTFRVPWAFNERYAFAITLPYDLDQSKTYTITVDKLVQSDPPIVEGPLQFLVGSGHLKITDSALAVFKMQSATNTALSISGGRCTDQCANYNGCEGCAADPKCGWCIDHGKCVPGDRSGPWTYGICKNWRYTFDNAISRRLTQDLAFPVNPGSTEVLLKSVDKDLPVEIIVQPRPPSADTWDIIYAIDYSLNIYAMFNVHVYSILNSLHNYPNLGVGFIGFNTMNNVPFQLARKLSNPRDDYWGPEAIKALPQTMTSKLSVRSVLNSGVLGWRAGSSRAIIVVAAHDWDPSDDNTPWDGLQKRLLTDNVVPVFLVTKEWVERYNQLKNYLGMGIVVPLPNTAADNIPQATSNILARISSFAQTFYGAEEDLSGKGGLIDGDQWNKFSKSYEMFGLSPTLKARFLVATNTTDNAKLGRSTLYIPGYGQSIVENILDDRPTASAPTRQYSVKQGQSVLITINGRSLRDLYKTVPRVVTLPPAGSGTLNLLVPLKDGNGNWNGSYSAGNQLYVGNTTNDLLNRILFTASYDQAWAGKNVTFKLAAFDTCVNSDPIEFTVLIVSANQPPTIGMVPVQMSEEQQRPITLQADDANNDKLEFYITKGIHELDDEGKVIQGRPLAGKLYQYNEDLLNKLNMPDRYIPGKPDPLDQYKNYLIDVPPSGGAPVKVTNGQVIFIPRPYVNSYADAKLTPDLLVHPCFEIIAKEVGTVENFSSSPARVTIDIAAVNQKPFIWGSPDWWKPWVNPDNIPYDKYTFIEDFNQTYPWNVPYQYIYVGGDDVEKSPLSIIITDISKCDPLASLKFDLSGDNPIDIKTNNRIDQVPGGRLYPGIRFRPGPDRNNQDGGFGSFYCQIKYKVNDGRPSEGDSATEQVITISVTPQVDPPRMDSQSSVVNAIESTPKEFVLSATSPDGPTDYRPFVRSCTKDNDGRFEVCLDDAISCRVKQVFTCKDVKAKNGIRLDKLLTTQSDPRKMKYTIIFTSGVLASPTEGLNYQILSMSFQNDAQMVTPDVFPVTINVIALNDPPVILLNNVSKEEYRITLNNNEKFVPGLTFNDIDIANGDITVMVRLEATEGVTFTCGSCPGDTFDPNRPGGGPQVIMRGKLVAVNAQLRELAFSGTKLNSDYKMVITANDNGNSGQCPYGPDKQPIPTDKILYDPQSTCPMITQATVYVRFVVPNASTYAIAAAGAGILLLGLLAAAIAARYFNSAAANSSYRPWDVFHESDAVLTNPLYETAMVGGSSAIYEGGNKGLLDGSDSGSPEYHQHN